MKLKASKDREHGAGSATSTSTRYRGRSETRLHSTVYTTGLELRPQDNPYSTSSSLCRVVVVVEFIILIGKALQTLPSLSVASASQSSSYDYYSMSRPKYEAMVL